MIGVRASQAFSPNKFADLILWLSAPDLATILESSGAVSKWILKSRENVGDADQVVGARQPFTGINAIGGKNVITFDDSDDQLEIPSNPFTAGLWLTGATLISVYRTNVITSFPRLASSGPEWGLFKSTSGTRFGMVVRFTTTNADFRSENLYSANTPEIVALTYDGSSDSNEPTWYLNGTIIPADTFTQPVGMYDDSVSGRMGIGNETFSNERPFGGDIAEIIVYKRIITSSELLEVHTYLSNKYGIALS